MLHWLNTQLTILSHSRILVQIHLPIKRHPEEFQVKNVRIRLLTKKMSKATFEACYLLINFLHNLIRRLRWYQLEAEYNLFAEVGGG